MRQVYLDHAAATPVDPRVFRVMQPYFTEQPGNPGSFHTPGLRAKEAVTAARETIAGILGARADEIIFTSGGTESDNLALVGTVRAHVTAGTHVITSSVEHPAVLEVLQFLAKRGEVDLTVLNVDRDGRVNPDDIASALRPTTILVSVMYANNEIGTIEPLADIGRVILKWRKENNTVYPLFHSDACQASGTLDLDVEKLHVDLLTINASKIYGPKGVGALYVRRGTKLHAQIRGGGQEKNIRSGTENVPGIVGLAEALRIAQDEKETENGRLSALRDQLVQGLLEIPKTRLNGHAHERLPNNANISFLDIEGEAAVLYLDAEGIYISTGSACASLSLDPSHVILATGLSYEGAHGSLRFSLGRSTTKEDIEYVIHTMPGIIQKLRAMSPVNLDMKYFVKEQE